MTNSYADSQEDSGSIDYTDPDDLRRLYWERGLSLSEIADRCGVSIGTIHRYMDQYEIERRDLSKANKGNTRVEYANYLTDARGYERWESYIGTDGNEQVAVHRLLAVAKYGFDNVCGKVVHHSKPIPWLNTHSNIELMGMADHSGMHNRGGDNGMSKLTESEARDVKIRANEGEPYSSIAADYPITEATVSEIKNGHSWSHITI